MADIPIPNDNTKEISPQIQKNTINDSIQSPAVNKQNKSANPKQDTNLIETYTSTKNKISGEGGLFKKIHFLEFNKKNNVNSIEFYLNNFLKNKNIVNSTEFNNNSPINKKISKEFDELPYNLSEHLLPLLDEENIIKILKSNDYFQDQSSDIFNLVINEIIYISANKDMKIYDINDLSNYFFIINKGSVNSVKFEVSTKHINAHFKAEKQITENNSNCRTYGPWESFGEISFYNGKNRNETIVAQENVELYAIDSESFRELLKRNNEIVLKEKYNFINNISIFESLDKISKYNVAQKLKKKGIPSKYKNYKKRRSRRYSIYYKRRNSFMQNRS